MDVVTRVELECSYGAGDGWTRSGVASMPKERSGGPRLDQSCDWEKYGYDTTSTTSHQSWWQTRVQDHPDAWFEVWPMLMPMPIPLPHQMGWIQRYQWRNILVDHDQARTHIRACGQCRDAYISRCAYTDQCSPELVHATQHSHPHPTCMRALQCAAWYTQ